jgi:hypothetical protein
MRKTYYFVDRFNQIKRKGGFTFLFSFFHFSACLALLLTLIRKWLPSGQESSLNSHVSDSAWFIQIDTLNLVYLMYGMWPDQCWLFNRLLLGHPAAITSHKNRFEDHSHNHCWSDMSTVLWGTLEKEGTGPGISAFSKAPEVICCPADRTGFLGYVKCDVNFCSCQWVGYFDHVFILETLTPIWRVSLSFGNTIELLKP